MNRTLIALWAIIFSSIVAAVSLAALWNHQRETEARLGLAGLLEQQLEPYNRDIAQLFAEYERELSLAFEGFDPNRVPDIHRLEGLPLVSQVVVLGGTGVHSSLVYPTLSNLSPQEQSLVSDAALWLRENNFSKISSSPTPLPNLSQAVPPPPAASKISRQQSAPSEVGDASSNSPFSSGPSSSSPSNRGTANAPLRDSPSGRAGANQLPDTQQIQIAQPDAQTQDATQVAQAQPAQSQSSRSQVPSSQVPLAQYVQTQQSIQAQNGLSQNALSSNRIVTNSDDSRWTTWYHGRGLVLGFWHPSPADLVTMVIVPRGRWLADIVAALPDNSAARSDALIQLVDVQGDVVTQWGNLDLSDSEKPNAEIAVTQPLEGWRLNIRLASTAQALTLGSGAAWASLLAAAGFSLTMMLLGILITLNLNRQMRLARQQVSFVNQVSHELRTPLTNIRMYTDLTIEGLETIESATDNDVQSELVRLKVIAQESSRLSRLIENVLSFARAGRCAPPLNMQSVADIDAHIDETIATFHPQLEELGIQLHRSANVRAPVRVDLQLLDQILVNLVSNAIKYAAGGKSLQIESSLNGLTLCLRVIDAGPGIPKRFRKRVFQPFVRVGNRLEDPAGTGIGLTIAQQLARRHGGDCTLEPSAVGCRFLVCLAVQL